MDHWVFILIAFTAAVLVIAYAAMRTIDYLFSERSARHAGEREYISDVRRCGMAKACIRSYNDGVERMSDKLVHGIVTEMTKFAKEMGDL